MRGESLVKEVIEGRMERKRERGKQSIMMLDDIKADESYEKIERRAMNRERKFICLKMVSINLNVN